MNNPLVSIIMPAYNTAMYISEAIQSILNQTYQEWELIVVDDASTDGTSVLIKDFAAKDSRIKPIFKTSNSGKPAIAKNTALENVVGEYIAFLDSDDLWFPQKLEIQINQMIRDRSIGLCYTGGYWIDANGKTIKEFMPQYALGFLISKMLLRYEINNQSVVISRNALENTLHAFNEDILIGEDYNLFMHIMAQYKALPIYEHLISYRIHNNALTKKQKRVSDGVLVTLKELHQLEKIYFKYPLYSFLTYIKAVRFKYFNPNC